MDLINDWEYMLAMNLF